MTGFSSEWLDLREPADHTARSASITDRLAAWTGEHVPVTVTDLGAGTGSNFRYLAPHLGRAQQWLLIDHDEKLLSALPDALSRWAHNNGYAVTINADGISIDGDSFSARATWRSLDLADGLARLDLTGTTLVTASALLDLASSHWIDSLLKLCCQHACAALFPLNYDGRVHWEPALADDKPLVDLLNRHQQRDKGLGMALGPHAGRHTVRQLASSGYEVFQHASDWVIDSAATELQTALATGWVAAASDMNPQLATDLTTWLQQRRDLRERGESRLTVGHLDVLGLPPARS